MIEESAGSQNLPSSQSAPLPSYGPITGVCSALLVPRDAEHAIDLAATERLIAFQVTQQVRAFALNGATGEYTRSSRAELQGLLQHVRSLLANGETLIFGVGGPDRNSVQELIELGYQVGVDGYLIPVPSYFPLQQGDIRAFIRSLALPRASYLYNLPSFTTGIEPSTALDLCRTKPGIVGVKDSSGNLATVELLTAEAPQAARIIGNDGALYAALRNRVCDGVVSGVAGVLPELMQALYTAASRDDEAVALRHKQALDEYIRWLDRFPVPWGLKLTAEYRGLFQAEFSLPFSEERQADAEEFLRWLEGHREQLLITEGNG